MKRIFFTLILSILCVIVYMISYEFIWRLRLLLVSGVNFDISWGLTVRYSIVVFSAVSVITNLIIVFWLGLKSRKILMTYLISIFVFFLFFVDIVYLSPIKVGILILSAFIASLTTLGIAKKMIVRYS